MSATIGCDGLPRSVASTVTIWAGVDPTPLAAGLAHGITWIQYHAENVRIVPVFGTGALNVSPRIGHLHVHIDDLPWGWVEATPDNNTISVAALPPGQHKMLVELVDANHHVFAGMRGVQADGNVHGPRDHVSPTLR
jgi:hypothetical protein